MTLNLEAVDPENAAKAAWNGFKTTFKDELPEGAEKIFRIGYMAGLASQILINLSEKK